MIHWTPLTLTVGVATTVAAMVLQWTPLTLAVGVVATVAGIALLWWDAANTDKPGGES